MRKGRDEESKEGARRTKGAVKQMKEHKRSTRKIRVGKLTSLKIITISMR